ncbi:MAG: T9SS type A sorting domain-containing protein [Bacteroidetes bacterium]|nr:T9SS type A sorting domain-containing protein [Bacteroidota bacterium]
MGRNLQEINFSDFSPGMYLLQVTTSEGSQVIRFAAE